MDENWYTNESLCIFYPDLQEDKKKKKKLPDTTYRQYVPAIFSLENQTGYFTTPQVLATINITD